MVNCIVKSTFLFEEPFTMNDKDKYNKVGGNHYDNKSIKDKDNLEFDEEPENEDEETNSNYSQRQADRSRYDNKYVDDDDVFEFDIDEELGENEASSGYSLRLIRMIISETPVEDFRRRYLLELRRSIINDEGEFRQRLRAIEQEAIRIHKEMEEQIEALTAPANRIGTLLDTPEDDTARVTIGGADYYANVDPQLESDNLKKGVSVLLNEAFVVVGELGYNESGPIAKISDILPDGRLRVGSEPSLQSVIIERATDLADVKLKPSDEVRLDPSLRVAVEYIASKEQKDYALEAVPEIPWSKVGGLDETIQRIKDTIEQPILHPELFKKFQYTVPKGFLLHGPPGCGKTLIGKATAYNLTERLKTETGEEIEGTFLHIKGPEILNMWLGESERKVREIFSTAREKRDEGKLAFVFIDEAESILGTRRAMRSHSISNTLVPMFCAEMDGIEPLQEVVIILATNRPDLIDPAILRPGRIDRKIKVTRPNKDAAKDIFGIYLTTDLPIETEQGETHDQEIVDQLITEVVDEMFRESSENRFLEVALRSGRRDILYRGHLCSGAIIESIVQRAKESAMKRAIAAPDTDTGITLDDLMDSLKNEYSENDIFPPTEATEDWLKLLDYDPVNVVKVTPIQSEKRETRKASSPVI